MTVRSCDGFLHLNGPVIAIKDHAQHPGNRHPLGKAQRGRFLRRGHPANQIVDRPDYPPPDGSCGIFDERMHAAPDLPRGQCSDVASWTSLVKRPLRKA